ncbi:hypothetical protein AOC10_01710 [Polynucleobacter asymbioticus]|uniref:UDP-2,4-diacetamido-2,4, 6-trideoxy-beta-L-altropyranose hydrolase n=1 Tax=Polynucleobacter asymbioticus TaxID=576611 RepID=UPI0008FB4950|nr:UDP-2,4-diacetamido-2,4,6-trideoxy-beta-L-altropyranose hydrolase [Polynucleobacter asymbioticus]APC05333.1 hypothetical protein AOC10_01710 [Polynucleobacter asymbioticus]
MRFIIRADASQVMGAGHIMRCLSLAQKLRARGAQTCFVSLDLPEHLESLLLSEGHEVRRLSEAVRNNELADAKATLSGETAVTTFIVDHYQLGTTWEGVVMQQAKVLALDDLGRPHISQWLLDQNYCLHPDARYRDHTPRSVQRLFGPAYALLRDEFVQARAVAQVRAGKIRHVLVFLGGMDVGNVTSIALDAIGLGLSNEVFVTVIVGASHPDLSGLREWCQKRGQAVLHVQVKDMTPYLLAADLAIGGGGSSTWERCVCGLPTVSICLADNQREVILEGTKAGFILGIEKIPTAETLAGVLKTLASAPGIIRHMSLQALLVADGRGTQRVADVLIPQNIQVRRATSADVRMIYEWRTSPEVMGVSRDTAPFNFQEHCLWMEKALTDVNRLLLIGVYLGQDIGVVRFDIADSLAEVSIFLSPSQIGSGLGRTLLEAAEDRLRQDYPQVRSLDAWVNEGNSRSFQMFKSLGYSQRIIHLNKEFA